MRGLGGRRRRRRRERGPRAGWPGLERKRHKLSVSRKKKETIVADSGADVSVAFALFVAGLAAVASAAAAVVVAVAVVIALFVVGTAAVVAAFICCGIVLVAPIMLLWQKRGR